VIRCPAFHRGACNWNGPLNKLIQHVMNQKCAQERISVQESKRIKLNIKVVIKLKVKTLVILSVRLNARVFFFQIYLRKLVRVRYIVLASAGAIVLFESFGFYQSCGSSFGRVRFFFYESAFRIFEPYLCLWWNPSYQSACRSATMFSLFIFPFSLFLSLPMMLIILWNRW